MLKLVKYAIQICTLNLCAVYLYHNKTLKQTDMETNGIRASILIKGEFRSQLEDKSGYFSKLQWNLRILWEGFGNSKEKVRKTVLKINASKEVKAEMLRYCCKKGNNGIIFNGRYGHFSCLVKGKKTTGIAFIPYNAEYESEWTKFYIA